MGLNPAYQVPELSYSINKVGIKALISSESCKTQNYYEMLAEIVPEMKGSQTRVIESPSCATLRAVIMDSTKEFA